MSEPQCETFPDGTKEWKVNGILHREDGPAIVWSDGSQFWYRDDQRHREDGPAVIWANGLEEYWEHGCRIIKNDHVQSSSRGP